jgi:hypothetical protein
VSCRGDLSDFSFFLPSENGIENVALKWSYSTVFWQSERFLLLENEIEIMTLKCFYNVSFW